MWGAFHQNNNNYLRSHSLGPREVGRTPLVQTQCVYIVVLFRRTYATVVVVMHETTKVFGPLHRPICRSAGTY